MPLPPAALDTKEEAPTAALIEQDGAIVASNYGAAGQEHATSVSVALTGGEEEDYFLSDAWKTSFDQENGTGTVRISATTLIYLCAVCSSLTSVLLGYDVGVMSAAILDIEEDMGLTSVQAELLVGSLNIVAAFGGLIAGKAADALGRKNAIALACAIFITGAGFMTVAQTYTQLLVGRILTGLGVGCGFVVAPVYITEITPPHIRGKLVAMTDIMINIGILLGYISGFVCQELVPGTGLEWRVMLGLGILPPLLIVCCLTFLPESPRWLISQGRVSEGYKVLLRVVDNPVEAWATLQVIMRSLDKGHSNQEPGWMDILWPKDKVLRAAMVVGLGLGFWQQASGSEAAVYYSPHVLQAAGLSSKELLLLGTIVVGLFKLVGEIVAAFLLDRIGRRPLFLFSAITCTISLFLVSLSFFLEWSAVPTLMVLCLFMGCFSLGIGPLTFVVAAEVFPLRVRGKAVSLVVFVNRFLSGAIAISFLSISNALTPGGAFLLFSFVSMLSVFFYQYCVPETKGKTLEQIADMLAQEFHLTERRSVWDSDLGQDMLNMQAFPSNERLVSAMSSSRLVAVVSSSDLKGSRSRNGSFIY